GSVYPVELVLPNSNRAMMTRFGRIAMCMLSFKGGSQSFTLRAHSAIRRTPVGRERVDGGGFGGGGAILNKSGYSARSRLSSSVIVDVESTSTDEPVEDLKARLLRASAGVNRGLSCREGDQDEIFEIVEELERQNPNSTPNDGFSEGASILTGEWKLIFTSALDVLSLGLIPGVEVGQIFQNINEDGTEITNVVDLQPKAAPVLERFAGSTSARLEVFAAASLEGDKRLTLSFRRSQYSPQTLLGRDVSATLPPFKVSFPEIPGTNAGWIDTTFIDEEIR
ncbi:unnamed protein product, partial [Ectocarpus sp. 8 AP-2014]